MSKLLNQWIDIFRAGNYGDKGSYTQSDLQQMADSYDPAKHEAPAVIGHPKTDAPAYGWFDKLRRVGDVLQGKMRQVEPAFEDAVEQGRYKKRSISLYGGPGNYSLRHVGFLGAQPPEIKGLADIAFEQQDKDAVEIEFSEETDMGMDEKDQQSIVDKLTEKLKGVFASHKPAETASAFSEEQNRQAIEAAVAAAVKPVQDALTEQQRVFAEGQTAAQSAASKGRADAAILKLKADGKYVAAFDKLGVPHLFEELAKIETPVEFGEGDAKVKKTPLELFVAFMEAQPKIVPTGREVEGGTQVAGAKREYAKGTDVNSARFSELAEELEKKEKITFAEAGRRVAQEHPELLVPGGATAGAV